MEISSKDLSLNEKLKDFKLMQQNTMSPVLPVVLPAVERKECSGIQRLLESVIVFLRMGAVLSLLKILLSNECIYDCKYCLNRVSNDRFVQHLLRTRSVHLLWNFIEEIILKDYF